MAYKASADTTTDSVSRPWGTVTGPLHLAGSPTTPGSVIDLPTLYNFSPGLEDLLLRPFSCAPSSDCGKSLDASTRPQQLISTHLDVTTGVTGASPSLLPTVTVYDVCSYVAALSWVLTIASIMHMCLQVTFAATCGSMA